MLKKDLVAVTFSVFSSFSALIPEKHLGAALMQETFALSLFSLESNTLFGSPPFAAQGCHIWEPPSCPKEIDLTKPK